MNNVVSSLIQDYIPKGRRNRPVTWVSGSLYEKYMVPEYITIHETGNVANGANALSHGRYIKSNRAANIPVSWHYTVDDTRIVNHLPLNESGWHCGDGIHGDGNRKSIGIEICVNADGNKNIANTNTALLVAHLIKTIPSLKPFPECVKQHFNWNGKNCPSTIRRTPNGWQSFLDEIKMYLNNNAAPIVVNYETTLVRIIVNGVTKLSLTGLTRSEAHARRSFVGKVKLQSAVDNEILKEFTVVAPTSTTIRVGSRVRVRSGAKTYTGGNLASFVYNTTYDVIRISGDRAIIGIGRSVTAAIKVSDLILA